MYSSCFMNGAVDHKLRRNARNGVARRGAPRRPTRTVSSEAIPTTRFIISSAVTQFMRFERKFSSLEGRRTSVSNARSPLILELRLPRPNATGFKRVTQRFLHFIERIEASITLVVPIGRYGRSSYGRRLLFPTSRREDASKLHLLRQLRIF